MFLVGTTLSPIPYIFCNVMADQEHYWRVSSVMAELSAINDLIWSVITNYTLWSSIKEISRSSVPDRSVMTFSTFRGLKLVLKLTR